MNEFIALFFNLSFLSAILRMSVTYILAGLAYTICVKAGIIDLGLEGKILFGAFVAVWITDLSGSPILGALAAGIFTMIAAFLAALPIVYLRANHVVTGVAFNFLMLGLTTVGIAMAWGRAGTSDTVDVQLKSGISSKLAEISPSMRTVFANQTPILYVAIAITVIAIIVIKKTRIGLRVRSIGENIVAADSLGINVRRYRVGVLVISGFLCGLAGADLSIGRLDYFTRDMSAGRGWIALAVGIIGRFEPSTTFLAALLIGTVEAMQIRLQTYLAIPSQLVQTIPFIVPLLILIGVGGVRVPTWLGKNYERGER